MRERKKPITEKDTPNFLLWQNPYLKNWTDLELVNPDLADIILKEDKEADEKWTEEVISRFNALDKDTQTKYLKESVEKIIGKFTDYSPTDNIKDPYDRI